MADRTERPEKRSIEISAGSGVAEALAAAAAVVLAIIGLAGALPGYMMAISCIAAGAALLFEGGAIASRYSRQISEVTESSENAEVAGGVAAESIAGAAGVVLGILALIGVSGLTLVAVANIVFGGALLIGSGATSHLGTTASTMREGGTQRLIREAVFVSAGGQVLVGIGAVVLGILALLGLAPYLLNLVALLGVGGSLMLGGTAIGTKMFTVLRRA